MAEGGAIVDKNLEKDRISKMIEAVMKVARGDYSVQIELSGKNDDLDSLGMGLNMMIDDIRNEITERQKAEETLRESEEKFRAIFESFHDVYYRTDKEGRITIISPSIRSRAGYDPNELIGRPVTDVYLNPADREVFIQKLKESGVINDYELKLKAKDGRVIETSVSSNIMFGKDGAPIGVEGVLRDITERKRAEEKIKKSLEEKEVLLKEIHHRVKNNMQIISSLLNIQSANIEDEEMQEVFTGCQNRIRSMALMHETLYRSEDLARIDFSEYIRRLTTRLVSIYREGMGPIALKLSVVDVYLDIDRAVPCGLIISELVSNSLKHAFPDGRGGEIAVKMYADKKKRHTLIVNDKGVGFPERLDFRETKSLGMQLVIDLVKQIKGTIKIGRNKGTEFKIVF